MKHKINNLIKRLVTAWKVLKHPYCVVLTYKNTKNTKCFYGRTAERLFLDYISSQLGDIENEEYGECKDLVYRILSRIDMLNDVFNLNNSVLLLSKLDGDNDVCVAYDCLSEADFNDLVNVEVD